MTPSEISFKAEASRQELVELSRKHIGMSNYQDVIHECFVIINDLLVLVRDLAKSVDTALIPPTDHLPMD